MENGCMNEKRGLLFIVHRLPKGLHIDGVVQIAPRPTDPAKGDRHEA
jgi:hypothetical protein